MPARCRGTAGRRGPRHGGPPWPAGCSSARRAGRPSRRPAGRTGLYPITPGAVVKIGRVPPSILACGTAALDLGVWDSRPRLSNRRRGDSRGRLSHTPKWHLIGVVGGERSGRLHEMSTCPSGFDHRPASPRSRRFGAFESWRLPPWGMLTPPRSDREIALWTVPGRIEDLLGRAGFEDTAVPEDVDGVGHPSGEVHRVRDDEHRLAVPGQVAHHGQDLAGHARVERAGGFVEEDDLGLHREGPGDGDPLLLAAGKLARPGLELVGQPDPFQQRAALCLRFGAGRPRTWIGASVTFWRTVRCGNRLKDWNTMPTFRRICRRVALRGRASPRRRVAGRRS